VKKRRIEKAKPQADRPPSESTGGSRRSFLTILWAVLGLAAVAEMIWVIVSFLRPTSQHTDDQKGNAVVSAGALTSFPAGTVTAFQRGQFYLVRLDDGGFLALSCKCTHLGCTVLWVEKERRFLCPCHASAFDITGSVTAPPASRALDILPITIQNSVVKVDTSKRTKRSEFKKEQIMYPPRT
jgi:cytochrome b6-f complex iron-sulfur subunit